MWNNEINDRVNGVTLFVIIFNYIYIILYYLSINVVFFYVFAIRFVKLYWPAEAHKLMAKQARVFFYEFGGSACLNFMPFLKQFWL